MADATQVDSESPLLKKKKSKIKILIITLATIIFSPIIVAVSVPIFFNPNDFKPEISELVEDLTGRDLTINGDISISFFPWLGLEVGAIVLSNTPEFDSEPFARVARADLKVELLPLLFDQQFELDKIAFSGFQLFLTQDEQGRSNWEDLMSDDTAENSTSESSTNLDNLAINGLDIENAQVIWRDKALGQQYEISNISISTGVLAWQQPVDFHLVAEVALNDPAMTAQIELETRIEYDLKDSRYNFNISKLQAQLQGAMFPNNSADFDLSAHVDIDVVQQQIKLTQINIDSYGIKLQSNLEITNFQDQPTFNGELQLSQSDLKTVLGKLGASPNAAQGIQSVALSTQFKGSTDAFSFSEMVLNVDENTIKGELEVVDLSLPHVTFTFAVDKLDIDKFTNQPERSVQSIEKTPSVQKEIELTHILPSLPVDMMTKLVLEGKLVVDNLITSGFMLNENVINIEAKSGKISISQQALVGEQGKVSVTLKLSEAEKIPQLTGNVNMTGVNVRALMLKLNQPLPQMEKSDAFESVDISLDLNISNNKIELSDMALNIDQTRLSGDLTIQLGAAIPEIVADLTADYLVVEDYFPPESEVEKQNTSMSVPGKNLKQSEKNTPLLTTILPKLPIEELRNLNMDVKLKLKKSSVFGVSFENSELSLQAKQGDIQLTCLGIEQSDAQLSCKIGVNTEDTKPKVSAKLDISGLNLRKLMNQLGVVLPETKGSNTFERFDLATEFSVDSTNLEFTKLLLKLDDTTLKGVLKIHAGEQPVIDAKLMVDRLNLDDYFPPASTEEDSRSNKKEHADFQEAEAQNKEGLPLDNLRRLKLDLALRVDELQAYNLKVSKVKIDLFGKKGLFRVYPLRGDLYNGVYEGKLFADFRSEKPKYKMDDQLKNIQLGSLFDDLDELSDGDKKKGKKSTTGTASAGWQLVFQGEGAQGFSGQAQFEIRDGATYKVSLSKVILNSLKGSVTGSKSSKQEAIDTTEFSRLAASMKIKNGVIQNEDLFLESEGIKATGSGKINLVTSQADYLIKANVVTGRGLLKLVEGRYIPIKVKGPLSNLSYYPDIGGGLSTLTGNVKKGSSQLGKNIKGVVEGSLKGVGDNLKKILE
ncbi:hypothetical protein MNBD_GAMMA16-707 [hydrothermal vent metagenome]|uniref:AsmA domain-containing protein n=1 Tax=hydrothermal vent metagenome TaxID=652676 RepID=A0A3B0ZDK4_9ZZZZ